jgi:hypothetical protein
MILLAPATHAFRPGGADGGSANAPSGTATGASRPARTPSIAWRRPLTRVRAPPSLSRRASLAAVRRSVRRATGREPARAGLRVDGAVVWGAVGAAAGGAGGGGGGGAGSGGGGGAGGGAGAGSGTGAGSGVGICASAPGESARKAPVTNSPTTPKRRTRGRPPASARCIMFPLPLPGLSGPDPTDQRPRRS